MLIPPHTKSPRGGDEEWGPGVFGWTTVGVELLHPPRGGPQIGPPLGSVRLPPHTILLGNSPYRGGAWLKFGFSVLIKYTPARSEETSSPRSIPDDDPSYRPMKRRGDLPSDRHDERPHDRPTERTPGQPTQLQPERSIHRAMERTTERAADHTPARSTGRSSYGATDDLVDLQS